MLRLLTMALAVCMVLTAERGAQTTTTVRQMCWASGDLVGDGNPIDIQHALCGVAPGDQASLKA